METSLVHTFTHNEAEYEFHLHLDKANHNAWIEIQAHKCDFTFDVGKILERYSDNPCLELNGPVGIQAVEKILDEFLIYDNACWN
jgi:hypothetical protein